MLNGYGRLVRAFSVAVCMLAASVTLIAAGVSVVSAQASDDSPKVTQPSSGAGGGEPGTVRLSPDQQHQIALETAVLEAAPLPEQVRAYGVVLDVARITDLTNNYANAQAQLQTAQAKFDVSKSAFDRAQSLVHSAILAKRDAEAAEGTFLTDQAALTAAQSQVKTLAATARQEWGPVIGKGIVERSSQVVRLIERDQFLIQVTLPPGIVLSEPPRAALAQAPTRNANIELSYVSPATRTDARIQGLSYFFVAPGDSGLLPGMNTIVYVPSGKTYEGVFLEDTHRAMAGPVFGVSPHRAGHLTTDQHRPACLRRRLRRPRHPGGIRDRDSGRTGSLVRGGQERASGRRQ